jgi:hypothetical protein
MPCQKGRAQNVFNNMLGFAVLSAEFEKMPCKEQSTKMCLTTRWFCCFLSAEFENALQKAEHKMCLTTC